MARKATRSARNSITKRDLSSVRRRRSSVASILETERANVVARDLCIMLHTIAGVLRTATGDDHRQEAYADCRCNWSPWKRIKDASYG